MTEDDIQLIVDARNESREFLTSQNEITYADGKRYWENFVHAGLIDVFICLRDGVPAGFIDFKRAECNIGIKLLEKYRSGVGRTALELAFRRIRESEPTKEILADIKNTNTVMLNTAPKCGFELVGADDIHHHWRVPLEFK